MSLFNVQIDFIHVDVYDPNTVTMGGKKEKINKYFNIVLNTKLKKRLNK